MLQELLYNKDGKLESICDTLVKFDMLYNDVS